LPGPSDVTIKRLFATSSNCCAFPDCPEPLVEGETVVGEVCHIRSANKGHGRFDPEQTDEERHEYDNLVLFCRKHHKIVDTEVSRYPPELLTAMKKAHEGHETRRFTISDENVQRLGEMLAAASTPAANLPAAPAGPSHPNWTIRELFLHIRPDLADDPEAKGWEQVKRNVMDQFSTGALRVWGRPRFSFGQRGVLKTVDEKHYWQHAEWLPWVLSEDGDQGNHVVVKNETGLPDYSDLRVNKAEALGIWPTALSPDEDRAEIYLLEAARRAYSQTRGFPVAEHAEAMAGSDEEILKWYCFWIGTRTQLLGARRPSTKIEPVSLTEPPKDFVITGNTLTLRERERQVIWENLRIKYDELPKVIEQLKVLAGTNAGDM
jgi:hypothetical protein